jgi:glycerol uptake facilitator-like aquaporin
MCTGIFVFIILINKSPAEVAPSQVPALQCLSIALALYAMIHVSVRGGACMNPAVGLVGTIYSVTQSAEHHSDELSSYWWAYVFGPWVGGALAGIIANVHIQSVEKLTQKNLVGGLLDNK